MRCPNCSGDRIVLASSPGQEPGRTCVCLACAHLWQAAGHEPRAAAEQDRA